MSSDQLMSVSCGWFTGRQSPRKQIPMAVTRWRHRLQTSRSATRLWRHRPLWHSTSGYYWQPDGELL